IPPVLGRHGFACGLLAEPGGRQPHRVGKPEEFIRQPRRIALPEAALEQSEREGFPGAEPPGGERGESKALPVDTLPDRFRIGDAVVWRPARRIAGSRGGLVLAALPIGTKWIGPRLLDQLAAVERAPAEARPGLGSELRHLGRGEIGIAAADAEEELNAALR